MESYAATQTAESVWAFTWTAVPSTAYEVWLDGSLLDTTAEGVGTYTAYVDGYIETPPPIEVHAVGTKSISRANPPHVHIQWRGIAASSGYIVERLVGGAWLKVLEVASDGIGWHAYRSGVLVDQVAEQYRVIAVNVAGVQGPPLAFNFTLVTTPKPPVVALSIDGGDLVVEGV